MYFANKDGLMGRTIYKPKPECDVMPKVVSRTLWNLVDILQDGSHKKEILTLHVSEYVSKVESPFLFRSCLYQVMDIISWHHRTLNRMDDPDDKMSFESWVAIDNPNYNPNNKRS